MINHRTLQARARWALAAALATVATSLAAAAPPARASATDMQCNFEVSNYNSCLKFDRHGTFWWSTYVGQDVYMPTQYSREIIACGARYRASVWGDDGAPGVSHDDLFIGNLDLAPGWPHANTSPGGISVQFSTPLFGFYLDEDPGVDTDELYARISFYDCHTGVTRNFITGTVQGDFRP